MGLTIGLVVSQLHITCQLKVVHEQEAERSAGTPYRASISV